MKATIIEPEFIQQESAENVDMKLKINVELSVGEVVMILPALRRYRNRKNNFYNKELRHTQEKHDALLQMIADYEKGMTEGTIEDAEKATEELRIAKDDFKKQNRYRRSAKRLKFKSEELYNEWNTLVEEISQKTVVVLPDGGLKTEDELGKVE